MKTKLLLILTLALLTACSETPVQNKTDKKTIDTKPVTKPDLKVDNNKILPSVKKDIKETKQVHKIETAPIEVNTPNGANLYAQKCASCHGKDAKKSALNASEPIAGWDSTKTQDALNGYKDGSYGRKMKNIMQGQTGPLSDSDIKLISDYISIL